MAQLKIKSNGKGVLPLPEVVSSSRNDAVGGNWTVKSIADPFDSASSVVDRTMNVSTLSDETSRLFRVRELVRSKVSLNTKESVDGVNKLGIDPGLLQAAEELRINTIVSKMNGSHDINLIKNGSEKSIGERLAADGTIDGWNQAVTYGLSLVNTKAFNSFLTGVRSVSREWADELRRMSNEISSIKDAGRYTLASTRSASITTRDKDEVIIPWGYRYTIDIARSAQKFFKSDPQGNDLVKDEGKQESEEFDTSTSEVNAFAPLIIDGRVALTTDVSGFLHRKKRSAVYGKRLLYPERMLTDPYRRVFGSKVKADGGVILIDVSGSMSLSEEDIEAILTAAPGALIMAYSHSPSSTGIPNLFILADRGKRVKRLRDVKYHNGGNGVDGPALEYAIKRRKGSEPLIWVCDGVVTDCHDHFSYELTSQCARLVKKHKIVVQGSMDVLLDSIKKGIFVSQPVGPIQDALLNNRL